MKKTAAILIPGRDPRSRYCAEALTDRGWQVAEYPTGQADVIVLPLGVRTPPELREELHTGQIVLGGRIGAERTELESLGVTVYDYYDDPILQAENAIPTAEGAIGILMGRLPVTITGMRCLITGFGRIGAALALRLALLGADVTVSARRDADLGRITALGLRAERTGQYRYSLGEYDAVINTVPASVFSENDYVNFKDDCLLLELASAPGGISESRCRERNLHFVRAPGLPGRCAPKTAGYAIADAVARILEMEARHAT